MNKERLHKPDSRHEQEFTAIYGRFADQIFRFALLRLSNRDEALDLVQETFARLWQALSRGQRMTNEKSFLFTIANHLIIDWYRKKKAISLESLAGDESDEPYDPEDRGALRDIVEGADGRRLVEAIDKLSPIYREAVYLRFIEDLSPPEIAEVLEIKPNAVSVRINRGIKELRKLSGFDLDEKHEK